ncbi:MAG TPA: 2OG-Fe(II) oxygenase [Steroidobacteraceae bacterium]|nr:2OG-Fe(II) oxygenase [Steroidobacteraceae bacterium]
MELFARDECIFYVKALISQELCNSFIQLYQDDPHKHPGYTASPSGERQLEAAVKVSTDVDVETDGAWTAAFAELHSSVTTVILSIAAQFSSLRVAPLRCTGYKIQHYKKNEGHFKWHFDALGPGGWDRQLALILYLNSVTDGGETSFHRQNLKIKPVAGDALFFPTFWTHLHCGEIPRSEDKYIISSFIRFAIPGPDDRPA